MSAVWLKGRWYRRYNRHGHYTAAYWRCLVVPLVQTIFLVDRGGQNVTSATITGAAGLMSVTVATTGTVHVGDVLVAGGGGGANTVAGTAVTARGTGTGGTGTYVVNNNTVVTSGTIAGTGGD